MNYKLIFDIDILGFFDSATVLATFPKHWATFYPTLLVPLFWIEL